MYPVTICIPVFNESRTIVEYLREIQEAFVNSSVHVIVVDDCSTDDTVRKIEEANFGDFVTVLRNSANRGHGPSVVSGLVRALEIPVELVATADGDGEVPASELKKLLSEIERTNDDLVEGQRVKQNEPSFRKIASWVAKVLVVILGGRVMRHVRDANTPARIYRRSALLEILNVLPPDAMTPNLITSMVSRRLNLRIGSVEIIRRNPKGGNTQGTTWEARYKILPSRRFIRFCLFAALNLLRFRLHSLRRS